MIHYVRNLRSDTPYCTDVRQNYTHRITFYVNKCGAQVYIMHHQIWL